MQAPAYAGACIILHRPDAQSLASCLGLVLIRPGEAGADPDVRQGPHGVPDLAGDVAGVLAVKGQEPPPARRGHGEGQV